MPPNSIVAVDFREVERLVGVLAPGGLDVLREHVFGLGQVLVLSERNDRGQQAEAEAENRGQHTEGPGAELRGHGVEAFLFSLAEESSEAFENRSEGPGST